MLHKYFARSKGPKYDSQSYVDHILGSFDFMKQFYSELQAYGKDVTEIKQILYNAVLLHDLGKLDDLNQDVLSGKCKTRLPIFHEDAGAAYWLNNKHTCVVAAILIYCHHRGLQNFSDELAKGECAFRCLDTDTKKGFSRTQEYISKYTKIHSQLIKGDTIDSKGSPEFNSLDWRILLSMLVDSDHSDSARHCLQYTAHSLDSNPRWGERLEKLDNIIALKGQNATNQNEADRNKLRTEMYQNCRNTILDKGITQCEAPVGSGKTSAVLANLLNKACSLKNTPQKLFIVVPFTSLIEQIVVNLREWVVLDDEDPEEVIVGHYHTADYSSLQSKQIISLWKARITVTTSVQFFETLAASKTSKLRKLHRLAGNLIFIDEFQSNLPLKLWPVAWKWLEHLASDWNCHMVLSSGSMIEIWNMVDKSAYNIPSIINPKIKDKLFSMEKGRIKYEICRKPLSIEALADFVKTKGVYPKVVVFNTVQNAAVFAAYLQKNIDVVHLSTALTPNHRKKVVEEIQQRLHKPTKEWVLVATSCIESGMDFSFGTGFREVFSVASTLQIGGRVNRNFSSVDSILYSFVVTGNHFNKHPLADNHGVFNCFDHDWFNIKNPYELMKYAMNEQYNTLDKDAVNQLVRDDSTLNFRYVSDGFKVIDSSTKMVLVSDKLRHMLMSNRKVPWSLVQMNSVQLWDYKIAQLGLTEINSSGIYYIEEDLYDKEMLGIMEYVLDIKASVDSILIV